MMQLLDVWTIANIIPYTFTVLCYTSLVVILVLKINHLNTIDSKVVTNRNMDNGLIDTNLT